eukprot:TRINITY_DN24708_c0_g1_i1.p2 TRINITY_DN24708_c0_g1~~TRINITY_DN24708_c0_g1_i1.p2  ORF type:complete len:239 (+),score=57.93 TRINITY_DN24708_c0_g1_i1:69-719(+)
MAKRSPQPLMMAGEHCTLQKHNSMGCAFVTCSSEVMRELVISIVESQSPEERGAELAIANHSVVVRRRVDKDTGLEYPKDFFLAWGRKAEKESPLDGAEILAAFDALIAAASSLFAGTSPAAAAAPTFGTAPAELPLPKFCFGSAPPPSPTFGTGASPYPGFRPPPGLSLEDYVAGDEDDESPRSSGSASSGSRPIEVDPLSFAPMYVYGTVCSQW